MNPEQWQQIKPILESAMELTPANRKAYLDGVCTDSSLRREIDSLQLLHDQADPKLLTPESPPLLNLQEDELRFRLPLGKRIGAYEILNEVAGGGMGAVYRAARAVVAYSGENQLRQGATITASNASPLPRAALSVALVLAGSSRCAPFPRAPSHP